MRPPGMAPVRPVKALGFPGVNADPKIGRMTVAGVCPGSNIQILLCLTYEPGAATGTLVRWTRYPQAPAQMD